MARRKILGISVTDEKLCLSLIKGGKLNRTVARHLPREAALLGKEEERRAFSAFLSETMKEEGIRCKKGALILPEETVIVKNLVLPEMDEKQLMVNLPYEFRQELKGTQEEYVFDYSWRKPPEKILSEEELEALIEEEEEPPAEPKGHHFLAAAVKREDLTALQGVLKAAGIQLVTMVPAEAALEWMLRDYQPMEPPFLEPEDEDDAVEEDEGLETQESDEDEDEGLESSDPDEEEDEGLEPQDPDEEENEGMEPADSDENEEEEPTEEEYLEEPLMPEKDYIVALPDLVDTRLYCFHGSCYLETRILPMGLMDSEDELAHAIGDALTDYDEAEVILGGAPDNPELLLYLEAEFPGRLGTASQRFPELSGEESFDDAFLAFAATR